MSARTHASNIVERCAIGQFEFCEELPFFNCPSLPVTIFEIVKFSFTRARHRDYEIANQNKRCSI